MACVLPANGPPSGLDVTQITYAAFGDDRGTNTFVEPLGGAREKGTDIEGMFSLVYSGGHLLTLTITSLADEMG